MIERKYLVPFDFTPVTLAALHYALRLSIQADASVDILHLVKKENDIPDAQLELADQLAKMDLSGEDKIKAVVQQGDIFKDLDEYAKANNNQLIVMGTHGMKGMQKLLGSNALKVITSSSIPFIVVQESWPSTSLNKIVVPFDLTKKSIQILGAAADLARQFQCEIHLLGGEQTDEFLIKKSRSNIAYSSKFLKAEGVRYKVKLLPRKRNFQTEVERYAEEVNADMIAVGYYAVSMLPFMDNFTQNLLTNKNKLPILVVNAEALTRMKTSFDFSG